MKLEIQLQNVVTANQNYYFIVTQLQYHDKVTPSQKFRTDIATISNRLKFNRNLFTFNQIIERQKLKFGLMLCENGQQSSVASAKLVGTASISLSHDRLKTLPAEGNKQIVHFMNKEKDVGQFQCIIRYQGERKRQANSKDDKESSNIIFNPLISRILFSQESSKDELKTQNSLAQLQKQMNLLYKKYQIVKKQEQNLENVYTTVMKDAQEIKNDIETYQRINEKISAKINQKEHLQSLRLEIDMLKNTQEGKRLLLERLEYFQERIVIQNNQYNKLAERYNHLKEEINRRIKDAEDYANRLKGKEMQQFQIQRNQDILTRYEQIQYEFKCNSQIIDSLAGKSKKSELTSGQAALLLSQVNYQIQLEQVSGGRLQQQGLLQKIQSQAAVMGKYHHEDINQEERIVLEIKLNALQEEISNIRNKIRKVLPKSKAFIQSQVTIY